MQHNLTT